MKRILNRISITFLCVIGLFISKITIQAQSSIEVRGGTSYSSVFFGSEQLDGQIKTIWKLKVNKSNPEKLAIRMITTTDDGFVWTFFTEKFKIENYVKLSSIPVVESSGNYAYTIEYSTDGINYSEVAPSDLSNVTGFKVHFPNPLAKATKITISFDLDPLLDIIPETSGLAISRSYDVDYGSRGPYYDRQLSSFYVAEMTDPAEPLTVKYVDENNNIINPDKTVQGIIGDIYDINSPDYLIDIPGYILDTANLPVNLQGMMNDEPKTIVIPYIKRIPQPVIVEYVDELGNELAPTETITGEYSDPYTTLPKTIYGWKLISTPNNAEGFITDEAQTVTYVYTRQEAADVIVNHVDEEGNELAPSETISGFIGDTYTTKPQSIEGWELKQSPANANGTLSDEAQIVSYVYTKVQVPQPEIPEGPETLPETGIAAQNYLLPSLLILAGFILINANSPRKKRISD